VRALHPWRHISVYRDNRNRIWLNRRPGKLCWYSVAKLRCRHLFQRSSYSVLEHCVHCMRTWHVSGFDNDSNLVNAARFGLPQTRLGRLFRRPSVRRRDRFDRPHLRDMWRRTVCSKRGDLMLNLLNFSLRSRQQDCGLHCHRRSSLHYVRCQHLPEHASVGLRIAGVRVFLQQLQCRAGADCLHIDSQYCLRTLRCRHI
jgi:hypothetical protein